MATRNEKHPLMPASLSAIAQALRPSVTPDPFTADLIPPALFGRAIDGLPQCVAHRGYRARYPENTMLAFREALRAGAHALETDIHITADRIVVLSHDPTLDRCFAHTGPISTRTWDELRSLRTVAEPREPMPKLTDLLTLLARPENAAAWVLLDIKSNDAYDAATTVRLVVEALEAVAPLPGRPWRDRVVLGVWAGRFLGPVLRFAPGFPVVHIGFSVLYARQWFPFANVGMNMLLPTLLGPGGRGFVRECRRRRNCPTFAWMVNEASLMRWCVEWRLDAVITDDPAEFRRVRADANVRRGWTPIGTVFGVVWFWLYATWLLITRGRKLLLPLPSLDAVRSGSQAKDHCIDLAISLPFWRHLMMQRDNFSIKIQQMIVRLRLPM